MEIQSIDTFLHYFKRIHQRTLRVIKYIPEDQFHWRPSEGSFSFIDIITHIAHINFEMYAKTTMGDPSEYSGHSKKGIDGKEVIQYFTETYEKCYNQFSQLTKEQLETKVKTPAGIEITCWKWLRAMIEHEIHHRGQIYSYLNILGVETPPLYGLTSEEVKERSKNR